MAWDPDENTTVLGVAFVHYSCVDPYLEQEGLDGSGMELGLFVEALDHNLLDLR